MARIGFVGLGNMGLPMALNLLKAGHHVTGYDLAPTPLARLREAGGAAAGSIAEAAGGAEAVLSMLPEGRHVEAAFLGEGGALGAAPPGAVLIDCSTIDVATARRVHAAAAGAGRAMLDAPVSGGVAGAEGGTLTFMVGGDPEAFARGEPLLGAMGQAVVHAGAAGAGQAAKICNNLILGASMIAVAEAFALAERLGLDAGRLFAISSRSSGQCWSMTSYCPVPGLVAAAPSNRDYRPGFTVAMMLKDLRLAEAAAAEVGQPAPLTAEASRLYARFAHDAAGLDFSAIIKAFARKPS